MLDEPLVTSYIYARIVCESISHLALIEAYIKSILLQSTINVNIM